MCFTNNHRLRLRIPSRPLASQHGPAVRVQRDQRPGRCLHPGHHGHLEQERCHPPSLKSVLQRFQLQSLNGKLGSKVAAPKTWNTCISSVDHGHNQVSTYMGPSTPILARIRNSISHKLNINQNTSNNSNLSTPRKVSDTTTMDGSMISGYREDDFHEHKVHVPSADRWQVRTATK